METSESFSRKVKLLQNKIKRYYDKVNMDERKPIYDGIVNMEQYFNSKIKILWILKEPYDSDNGVVGEGGWELNGLLNDVHNIHTLGGLKTTWYPIIYTSYAILNGFQKYEDLEFIDKDPTMLNIFKKIAFMNVQKFPARKSTDDADISNAYKLHSHILIEQINTYKPNIVIGGNTLWNFIDDMGLKEFEDYDEFNFWIKENRLYINAYHPAFRGSEQKKSDFVDDIVRISKRFYDEHLNKSGI